MKTKFYFFLLFFITGGLVQAQNSFFGVQNSHRKSMHSVWMNPAEINNLHRKVEINLFSVQAGLSNNVLSFQNVLNDTDNVLNGLFQNANQPANVRTNVEIMGPSVGFKLNKWAFGFTTQSFASAHIIDFDPNLGESLTREQTGTFSNIISINSPYNQRINITGWSELGFTAGLELIELADHSLSVGGTLKLLFPYTYVNIGVDNLNGTLVQNNDEYYLTNTTGTANINYPEIVLDEEALGLSVSPFNFGNLNGIGIDIGANYKWKDENGTKVNAGLSIRNIGSMTFGKDQRNTSYSINIPEGEIFSLDDLDGNLEEIENQLVNSGFFSQNVQSDGIKTNLPTLIAAYGELKVTSKFYVSLYGQQNFGNNNKDNQIINQNLIVITPRLLLGNFEIYSPWVNYEVAGLTGGLGLRVGGFFIGSNSILTGLIADTNQLDVHLGISFGVGK
jgi:hypothetical protein